MSLWSKLFGGPASDPDEAPATGTSETYQGFTITPQPIKESGGYRVAALIEKDGQSHQIIRADVVQSVEEAQQISALKARKVVDEQGDRLFF